MRLTRWAIPVVAGATLLIGAGDARTDRTALATGQYLTPLAAPGARYEALVTHAGPYPDYIADGAAAVAVSPDGAEMLVLTSGFNRYSGPHGSIEVGQAGEYVLRYAIDGAGSHLLQTLIVPNSYSGIAWTPDGAGFVVGGGVDDVVHRFRREGDRFAEVTPAIPLGHHDRGLGMNVRPQAAGVAVSPDGHRALVANYYNDSVSLIDLDAGRVVVEQDLRPGRINRAQRGVPGGENPFAIVWRDATHAYVSAPRDRQIVALSLAPAAIRVTARIATIGLPTALMLDPAHHRLFATEDNADRLAIVDTRADRLAGEPRIDLPAALGHRFPGKGINPNALAMLPDGRLAVTLGGINALAFVAIEGAAARTDGLVPTGWYPSAVALSRDGARLFITNRKSPPGANPQGCPPQVAFYRSQGNACGTANQYIYQLEKAGLLQFPMPDARALATTTLQLADNIGLSSAAERAEAERRMAAIRARIRHVVFIVKENRTYDQLLGDLPVGNGDPHLAILGRSLSPNHHALAEQFVTLDNFYDSGEQSSTGWTWTTAARATDLLEKNAPVNYAQRGLAYEAEEADRFIYTGQTMAQRRATDPRIANDPDLLPGRALLTAPDGDEDSQKGQGFLWNAALRAGLTLRNYGFSDASIYDAGTPGTVPLVRDPAASRTRIYTPGDPLFAGRSDPYYRGFDLKLPDYWRAHEWLREFRQQQASGQMPALTLLRLGGDHFGDFAEAIDGVNSVETQMADNDYALGQVVDAIAHSRFAADTLVFVIEDDAQNGADHVDARRSIAFVVGPYVRHGALVSTRYTTVSLLRTIESVLGLAPLGLNDALAMPMADLFDPAQRDWTFTARAADVLRTTQLPIPADRFVARTASACLPSAPPRSSAWWAAAMAGQNFATEDHLDEPRFNAALWRGLGTGPQPLIRDGRDLRQDRVARASSGCGGGATRAAR